MLEFNNVSMSYDSKRMVLENVNLKLQEGDYCVIYGRSGAGKSTFLSIGAGLIKPLEGSLIIDEKDILKMHKRELCKFRNLNIGYLPQNSTLLDSLTVLDNVCFPYLIYNKNVDYKALYSMGKELLKYVGMDKYTNEFPSNLSGGEKRRVEIARTLINKPKYIIVDEPTANLDNENVAVLLKIFKKVNKDYAALLVSTHDDRFLNEANKLLKIKDGKLINI